jgi:hypothetical protein
MERIQALIDKLYEQKQQNSPPAQLLFTVQLLQSELLKLQQKTGTAGTSKVAVTLPVNMNFAEEFSRSFRAEEPVPSPYEPKVTAPEARPVVNDPAPVPETAPPVFIESIPSPVADTKDQSPYSLRKPAFSEPPLPETPAKQQVLNPAFQPSAETPTLTQSGKKEVNDIMAEQKLSLNDRLKQEKTEVVHALKETPIKDLRKGIGINDRFTFVNELFRGDDAMYERSIKTINGFHILSEAEYWINRELKFKLGWVDTKDTVQHFYHLVRRRFA